MRFTGRIGAGSGWRNCGSQEQNSGPASCIEQLAALKPLRQKAKLAMVKEVRRQTAYLWLMSVPKLGSVSVAQLIAVVGTPHRFRSKQQFWTYVGLAVVTRSTADHEVVGGVLRRSQRPVSTRGLNRNHNHVLKRVFKNAATSACHSGPFKAGYDVAAGARDGSQFGALDDRPPVGGDHVSDLETWGAIRSGKDETAGGLRKQLQRLPK